MHHEQTLFVVLYSQEMKVRPLSAPQALSYLPSPLTFQGIDICCVCVCACVRVRMHVLSCVALRLHELQPARLLCPRNFLGKNTRVGCHFLPQGIFLTQGSNPLAL